MSLPKPLLNFGKASVEKYKEVNEKLFDGQLSNKELFTLAAGFGVFYAQKRTEFQKDSTGPRTELTDEDLYLFLAVALSESLEGETLPSSEQRDAVIIQFAEGGIEYLYELVNDKTKDHAKTLLMKEFAEMAK